MKKLIIISLILILATSAFGQFQQKPMLGQQINWANPPSKGLVGFWLFNEGSGNKVFDLSGNGLTGTITTATWSAGKYGSSLDFNGSSGYVNCGSGASIDNIFAGGGTFVAWVMIRTDGENDQGRIYQKGPSTDQVNLLQVRSNNTWRFYYLFTVNAGSWDTPNNSVVYNIPQMVVVTYDNSSSANIPKIYINGINQILTENSAPDGTAKSDAAYNLYLGNRNLGDRTFDGRISHILFYNRALSASEVAELYREPFCMFEQDDIALIASVTAPPSVVPTLYYYSRFTPLLAIIAFCFILGRKNDSPDNRT